MLTRTKSSSGTGLNFSTGELGLEPICFKGKLNIFFLIFGFSSSFQALCRQSPLESDPAECGRDGPPNGLREEGPGSFGDHAGEWGLERVVPVFGL